ncbi:hypothetical protein EYF80_049438 [Liparis tanakae]|uniref:Uncharacterized protein n=1 Tax=Liparis tanakae TaxID=230148 RepID=A0A4Z2FI05_9TELE|nr:hypothetical protein EYF80_049438 [Liparis tanakae]
MDSSSSIWPTKLSVMWKYAEKSPGEHGEHAEKLLPPHLPCCASPPSVRHCCSAAEDGQVHRNAAEPVARACDVTHEHLRANKPREDLRGIFRSFLEHTVGAATQHTEPSTDSTSTRRPRDPPQIFST